MATEAELAMLVEDYRTLLVKLAERARDCEGDLECQCPAEIGWGYAYDAGVAAGLEQAAMMAKSMLSCARLDDNAYSIDGRRRATLTRGAGPGGGRTGARR